MREDIQKESEHMESRHIWGKPCQKMNHCSGYAIGWWWLWSSSS